VIFGISFPSTSIFIVIHPTPFSAPQYFIDDYGIDIGGSRILLPYFFLKQLWKERKKNKNKEFIISSRNILHEYTPPYQIKGRT
jgi:hypothetical protein